MCLGKNPRGRRRECRGRLGPPTIRTALRCREDARGAGLRPRSLRSARGARERGGGEPVQALAARARAGRGRSSRRRPPGPSSRTRKSPRYLAHAQPPWTGWYQGGVVGQQACSGKSPGCAATCSRFSGGVNRSEEESSVGRTARASPTTRGETARSRTTALVEPLARRPQWTPLGGGVQRWSNRAGGAHN